MTRRNVIDQIRRLYYNGIPPDTAEVTPNLVNAYLNEGIAAAAKKNFQENYAVDHLGSVADGFYMTFSPFSLTKDSNTGWYSFDMPNMPLSLPAGSAVGNMFLILPSKIKIECDRVTTRDIQVMFNMVLDTSEVYYWLEGKKAFFMSFKQDLSGCKAYVRMPYSDSSDLDSEINCPPDMVPDVIEFTLKALMIQMKVPGMVNNEAIETRDLKP